MVEKQDVMTKLDEVEDPELELSIVELGLVYDVRFEEKSEGLHAEVDLTLTSLWTSLRLHSGFTLTSLRLHFDFVLASSL